MTTFFNLIAKDIRLEFRQKSVLFSILLYTVSVVYVANLVFGQVPDHRTWNALFWVIALFGSLQATARSFHTEAAESFGFYFQLIKPQQIILAKIVYNTLFLLITLLLTYGVFGLFLGNPVKLISWFLLLIVISAFGFSSVLTLINGIAAKTDNNTTLMAILSLPLMLPLLITVIPASFHCISGTNISEWYNLLLAIGLLNVTIVTLSYFLFAYIWRD